MHTVLYLVAQADKHTPYCEFFDSMEIMNETDLRYFFKTEIENGNIAQKNLDDHDITDQDDLWNIELSEILAVLSDNDEYDENNSYYVSQQEVRIDEQDMYD